MTFNQSLLQFLTENNISPADFAAEMGIKHIQNVKHLTNPRLNTLIDIRATLSALTGRTVVFDLNEGMFSFEQKVFIFAKVNGTSRFCNVAQTNNEARLKMRLPVSDWELGSISDLEDFGLLWDSQEIFYSNDK